MTVRIDWTSGMRPLGDAVVAIGVFDGVHAGHRALLAAAVAEARRTGAAAVALTFDQDPDHVVRPEAAAPELLALDDRIAALAATGVDVVLVVPFDHDFAAMPAEAFLDVVLGTCCRAVAIHVGEGFRFGSHAEGDLDTLYVWGVEHGAEVRPHGLVRLEGAPVSSTRIRTLIAEGDIDTAGRLLGRPPRIRGTVHHGRGEGAELGFATANVTPNDLACLPADGVYAGRALLPDNTVWPAAVSIGVPPSFPQATDYVEAHLIGFSGDLYGSGIVLEFLSRLRSQQAFESTEELTKAIDADVRRTLELNGFDPGGSPLADDGAAEPEADRAYLFGSALAGILTTADQLEDGTPVVADPDVLEAAERAAAGAPRAGSGCGSACGSGQSRAWAVAYGPVRLSSLLSDGGSAGALVTGPLQAAGIPYEWDPFDPGLARGARPDFNWRREFRLLVPEDMVDEARSLLSFMG